MNRSVRGISLSPMSPHLHLSKRHVQFVEESPGPVQLGSLHCLPMRVTLLQCVCLGPLCPGLSFCGFSKGNMYVRSHFHPLVPRWHLPCADQVSMQPEVSNSNGWGRHPWSRSGRRECTPTMAHSLLAAPRVCSGSTAGSCHSEVHQVSWRGQNLPLKQYVRSVWQPSSMAVGHFSIEGVPLSSLQVESEFKTGWHSRRAMWPVCECLCVLTLSDTSLLDHDFWFSVPCFGNFLSLQG